MPDLITGNAAIGQSGGPTAVINQSLVGVIEGLQAGLHKSGRVKTIYGMRNGVKGLTKPGGADLVALGGIAQDRLDRLASTPSAALGSTRDKPDDAYCDRILEACRKNDIAYFFYIGGNDSADTCRIVSEKAQAAGDPLRCFHVPKTIDNDLLVNDHTPGFGSAARYVTLAFMGDALDNQSLGGIKINVVMGRNAGFLTAAAALARGQAGQGDIAPADRPAPHLIYLPEMTFGEEQFLADVESVYSRLGYCQIAVSEGIRDDKGEEMGPKLMSAKTFDSHGNVQLSGSGALGDGLAELIKTKMTPKGGKAPRVRADTFGYIQRCYPDVSRVDAGEARAVGRRAAELAAAGETHATVVIKRNSGNAYGATFEREDLSAVARRTKHMPPEFFAADNDVTAAFVHYCRPLVGELPSFERLR